MLRSLPWLLVALLVASCGEPDDDPDAEKPIVITPAVAVAEPTAPVNPAVEPALAYDGTRAHLVYCQTDGLGDHNIVYAQRVGAGPFNTPAPLFPASTGDSRRPSVALDSAGTLHVVWVEGTAPNRDIWYLTRNALGSISGASNLSNTAGQDENNPRVHVDVSGRVHAVWEGASGGTSAIFHRRTVGSIFAAAQALPFSANGVSGEMPDVGSDADQHVYVVWSENVGGHRDIRMMRSDDNGASFNNIGNGIAVGGSTDATEPRISCGLLGEVHLAFIAQDSGGDRGLFVTFTLTGGTFGQPLQLFVSTTGGVRTPSIASFLQTGGKRTVMVAFNDGPLAGGNILVRTSRDGGINWAGDPLDLSQGNSQPTTNLTPCIAMDDNELVLSWVGQPQGGGVARTFTSNNTYTIPE